MIIPFRSFTFLHYIKEYIIYNRLIFLPDKKDDNWYGWNLTGLCRWEALLSLSSLVAGLDITSISDEVHVSSSSQEFVSLDPIFTKSEWLN